jgi:hypothetical protein
MSADTEQRKLAAIMFTDVVGYSALSQRNSIEILARVVAQMGEPERSIAALEKLLSMPGQGALAENGPLTPALLRLDPMFDPLRNDPRFQKLADTAASTALIGAIRAIRSISKTFPVTAGQFVRSTSMNSQK